jgi:hypothetical protein
MKTTSIVLPLKPLDGYDVPSVTALHSQADGSIYCGTIFSAPCLFRVRADAAGTLSVETVDLEKDLGKGLLGVQNGLRRTLSGETAFTVLQEGFAPGFVRKLSGGDLKGRSGPALVKFLAEQDGGMGVGVRHSICEFISKELRVRRFREAGALIDTARIGDFIFGLTGSSVWREPYLNTEKRETLRKDLDGTRALHRDSVGNFWFQGQQGRLVRMGQMDIKAKPTPLRLRGWTPGGSFDLSAASPVDEWLYGTTFDSRVLFRVRVNPVTNEDEMQIVGEYGQRISALTFLEDLDPEAVLAHAAPVEGDAFVPRAVTLCVAFEGSEAAEIHTAPHATVEDPELLADTPTLSFRGRVPEVRVLGSLTSDGKALYAGEGRFGASEAKLTPAGLRVFRIEL